MKKRILDEVEMIKTGDNQLTITKNGNEKDRNMRESVTITLDQVESLLKLPIMTPSSRASSMLDS